MRLLLLSCFAMALVYQASARPQWWDSFKSSVKDAGDFVSGAAKGTGDMYDAYSDMKESNWKESDKYFHARGNYDAAQHGAGGKWAAEVISDAREGLQSAFGRGDEDVAADQEANKWGRDGNDPNKYRPKGLPEEYKR